MKTNGRNIILGSFKKVSCPRGWSERTEDDLVAGRAEAEGL